MIAKKERIKWRKIKAAPLLSFHRTCVCLPFCFRNKLSGDTLEVCLFFFFFNQHNGITVEGLLRRRHATTTTWHVSTGFPSGYSSLRFFRKEGNNTLRILNDFFLDSETMVGSKFDFAIAQLWRFFKLICRWDQNAREFLIKFFKCN